MIVKRIMTGGDRNFAYVLADKGAHQAAIIDPSYSPDRVVQWARDEGCAVAYILVTHDHADHTNGNERAKALTGAKIVMHEDPGSTADLWVKDGDAISLGALTVRVIHTPGHTPTSVCYYVADALFTGDTLFVGKVGGTDFSEGARQEYDSLHRKLMTLPDETRVFPGHNYGVRPESTIGDERATNPFLLQPDFAAFVHLKENWAEYKIEHGIP